MAGPLLLSAAVVALGIRDRGRTVGQRSTRRKKPAKAFEWFGDEAVPAPRAAAFAVEDAGGDEYSQVVAERGLGHVEVLGEVAEARFAAGECRMRETSRIRTGSDRALNNFAVVSASTSETTATGSASRSVTATGFERT